MLGSDIFHATQDFGIVRARKLGHDDAQDVRSLHAKTAGKEVGVVIQSFDCATNALCQFFADSGFAVDYRRDSGYGYFREPAHIPDCYATTRSSFGHIKSIRSVIFQYIFAIMAAQLNGSDYPESGIEVHAK